MTASLPTGWRAADILSPSASTIPISPELQKLGVGAKVEPLGGKAAEAWRLSTGWGAVRLVNKAPHLNAATVFVNWLSV